MKKAKYFLLLVVFMTFPMIQNCTTSRSGGGINGIAVSETLINNGWDAIKLGNYTSAETHFRNSLKENLTESQRMSANSGLGWSLSKNSKILESIPYFEIASISDNEAKVGLASALVYRHQSIDYVNAAEILGNMPPERFVAQHAGLALTPAKVHALAALAYALAGDKEMGIVYMNKAAALDSMMVGTTVDRLDEAFDALGWKDIQN